jgi:PTS system fructose-specific IIC component
MPVVIIPLLATTVTGAAMLLLLGAPIASLMTALTSALSGLGAAGLAVLGLVLGLMMAFDMGGPVNKVAYTFATTGLVAAGTAASAPEFQVMAIVMAAGMTPPLGLALATVLRKKAFSEAEQENGKAAWLLGATFITEGAIPFAAADPLRVIPSIMIGSGITGALVALFGNELRAPHGGFMVFGLTSNWYTYVLAIAIGTVITAALVLVAKGIGTKKK